jgi:hypothetical protein
MKEKPTKIKMLTQKQYIKHSGCICPICHTADVSGGPVQIDGGYAWQDVDCGNCNAGKIIIN